MADRDDIPDRDDEDEQPRPVRSITGMAPLARAVEPARSITGMEPLVPAEPMPAMMAAPAMPIQKAAAPNVQEDILAGKVAPPEWKDYKPNKVTPGRKILGILGALGEGITTRNIPATIGAYHSIAEGPQREEFNEAQQAYKDTLGEAERGQKSAATEAETGLKKSQADEAEARAAALRNPVPKEGLTNDEQLFHDLTAGDNGKPRLNPDTKQPYTALEAYQKISQLKSGTADDRLRDEMAKLGYNVSVDPTTKELSVSPIAGFTPPNKDTQTQEAEKYEKIETAKRLGQPVSREDQAWHDAFQKRMTLGPYATAAAQAPEKGTERADRSYNLNSTQLEKIAQPIEQRAQRLSDLVTNVNFRTPQADALIAPELLSVIAGGQGSGLRMNEAEISRVIGGSTHWTQLQEALNKWSTDPAHAIFTDEQRNQMRQIIGAAQAKLTAKSAILEDARHSLIDTDDVKQQRQTVAEARKLLDAVDQGKKIIRRDGKIQIAGR